MADALTMARDVLRMVAIGIQQHHITARDVEFLYDDGHKRVSVHRLAVEAMQGLEREIAARGVAVDRQTQAGDAGAVLSDEQIEAVWWKSEGYRPGEIAQRHAVDFARAILASAPKAAVPEVAALARKDALLRQAMEAMRMAHTGLEWYRGMMTEYVDGSDSEADEEINAAIAAISAELKEQDK